jgi:hypothetical protein
MAGGTGADVPENDRERVDRWLDDSVDRWSELARGLPEGRGARMIHGHYAIAYQIVGDFETPQGANLLEHLRGGAVRYTGRPPFEVPPRRGPDPYPHEGNIECWFGGVDDDVGPADSHHWRVSPDAQFFILRGYQEDAAQNRGFEPGTLFEISIMAWRIGEIILHAESMARQFGAEQARVIIAAKWTGLTGRQISTYAAPNYGFLTQNISHQDVHRTSVEIQVDRIADELPELVDSIIRPLYELFDFFTLPATLVSEELARMRNLLR